MIEYGKEEMAYISSKSTVMQILVKRYGQLEMGHVTDVYSSLVIHIISQMLSNNVADVLTGRFINLVGEIRPEVISKLAIEDIRQCGISQKKAEYIIELSNKVHSGEYDFSGIDDLADDQVISYLMKIKGVGRWTAEMIAEFTMGRKNIFSFDDVALQNGIKSAHGFKTLSKTRFERLRKLYSPYCSIASLYYYSYNDDKNREPINV